MMLEGSPEFAELTYGWWLMTFPGFPVDDDVDQDCSPGLGGFRTYPDVSSDGGLERGDAARLSHFVLQPFQGSLAGLALQHQVVVRFLNG